MEIVGDFEYEAGQRLRIAGRADFFLFNKYDDDAPIDEITSDNTYLGSEIDLFAIWQMTKIFELSQVKAEITQVANDKDNKYNGYLLFGFLVFILASSL